MKEFTRTPLLEAQFTSGTQSRRATIPSSWTPNGGGFERAAEPEADPYETTSELAVTLEVSQSTFVRGLKSIDKVRKLGRRVPHALKQYDMDRRANMRLPILMHKNTHTWLEHPVTGNEK
ncbi:unnamed protein product [Haemonchus placei]|uniref:HTH_17 domain-containing protein n=1 Tax=Haemonchus placei TaxID=6290 RepID=A0A0N4WJ84_HAEPC|nr:unnamed protein product [Haemonchus placei]